MHVGRPKREIISEKLHNESAILIALLLKIVYLAYSVIERLFRQLARLLRIIHNLVIEDGEIERQAETNGMSDGEFLGRLRRMFIRLFSFFYGLFTLVILLKFGQIAMIVRFP